MGWRRTVEDDVKRKDWCGRRGGGMLNRYLGTVEPLRV